MIVRDPHSEEPLTVDADACVVLCGGNMLTHWSRLCANRTHLESPLDYDPPWWASFRVVRTVKEDPCS